MGGLFVFECAKSLQNADDRAWNFILAVHMSTLYVAVFLYSIGGVVASVREMRTGRFELTIRNKLLQSWCIWLLRQVKTPRQAGRMLLAAGVVPVDLVKADAEPKPTNSCASSLARG